MHQQVIIIGAGHSGGRCALALRQKGYDGSITLVGGEPYPPYERPPLSKQALSGKAALDSGYLKPVAGYAEAGIELMLDSTVTAIDLQKNRVSIVDKKRQHESDIGYQHLVLAMGGNARRLTCPGSGLEQVTCLRDIDDCRELANSLQQKPRVTIIGGGFIGLEVAATARQLDCEVTVLEAGNQLLSRVFPAQIAAVVADLHQQNGVIIRTGIEVESLLGNASVSAVQLASGEVIETDLVVVGIGLEVKTGLASAAGLKVGSGILTDEFCQTRFPGIYAIGDCAEAFNRRYQQPMRLESWQNAEQQAELVAGHLCGESTPWQSVPWFWSDQFQYNIQMVGVIYPDDEIVLRGDLSDQKLLIFARRNGKLTGAIAIGIGTKAARDLRVAQMLLEHRSNPAVEQLTDLSIALKKLLS